MDIPADEFHRLAYIAGDPEFGDDVEPYNDRSTEIPAFLEGTIEQAWQRCLLEWMAFGRVRDLSRCVRVPSYLPSFANKLGLCFVEQFRGEYEFLIHRLINYPVDSYEYLCTVDLIEYMLYRHEDDETPEVLERLFALTHPLPPVIQYECRCCEQNAEYDCTVGQYLRDRAQSPS